MAVAALALAFGILVGIYVVQAFQPEPFDPLGEYPIQQVANTVPGVSGPAVLLGQDLSVSGTKCNDTNKQVAVRGQYEWVLTVPPGTTVPHPPGTGIRLPGCTAFVFSNPMPDRVIARSQSLYEQTGKNPVWRISGFEIPYDEEHGAGVKQTFVSENFTVVVGP